MNFALFSENATGVELCLFDGPDAAKESHRIWLEERTDQTWHAYLPEVAISGTIEWSDAMFGYRIGDPVADLSRDDRDNAGCAPRAW